MPSMPNKHPPGRPKRRVMLLEGCPRKDHIGLVIYGDRFLGVSNGEGHIQRVGRLGPDEVHRLPYSVRTYIMGDGGSLKFSTARGLAKAEYRD